MLYRGTDRVEQDHRSFSAPSRRPSTALSETSNQTVFLDHGDHVIELAAHDDGPLSRKGTGGLSPCEGVAPNETKAGGQLDFSEEVPPGKRRRFHNSATSERAQLHGDV